MVYENILRSGYIRIFSNLNQLIHNLFVHPVHFFYEVSSTKKAGYFKLQTENDEENARFIKPSIRADRIISYLQALKQDYELPEMAFIEEDEEVADSANEIESTKTDQNASDALPQWLADQMEAGKEVYMKAAPGVAYVLHATNLPV